MAISNSQYDAIMREYEERREKNRHIQIEHRNEVYELIPEYKAIDSKIADIAMNSALAYLDGEEDAVRVMKIEIEKLTARQRQLLEQFSFPSDYLDEKYTCEDCKDTGYYDNQEKCHCLKQEILKVLYKQSNIEEMLARDNFDTLSYDYYDDNDLDMMKRIIGECKSFADNFGRQYENILLYGNVGVGKTFLSNCIAKEVLEKGYSVIYFTSIRLFDTLSKSIFRKNEDDEGERQDILSDIFSCDLLIIDDLGTENANSFVASRLFDVLNERDIRKKPTVISTNLSVDAIQDRYTERNFSRIFGGYKVMNPNITDIRIKKRRLVRL